MLIMLRAGFCQLRACLQNVWRRQAKRHSDRDSSEFLISASSLVLHHFTCKSLLWTPLATRHNSVSHWWFYLVEVVRALKLSLYFTASTQCRQHREEKWCCCCPQGKAKWGFREQRGILTAWDSNDQCLQTSNKCTKLSICLWMNSVVRNMFFSNYTFAHCFPHFLLPCSERGGSHPPHSIQH